MSTLAPPKRPSPSAARRRAASAAAPRDWEPPHVAGAETCLCAMCHLRPTRFPRRLDGRIVLPDPLAAVRAGGRTEPAPRVRAGSFVQDYAGGERGGDGTAEDRGEGPSSRGGGQWHGDAESRAWFERTAGHGGPDSTPSARPGTAGDVRDAARARRADVRQAVDAQRAPPRTRQASLSERVRPQHRTKPYVPTAMAADMGEGSSTQTPASGQWHRDSHSGHAPDVQETRAYHTERHPNSGDVHAPVAAQAPTRSRQASLSEHARSHRTKPYDAQSTRPDPWPRIAAGEPPETAPRHPAHFLPTTFEDFTARYPAASLGRPRGEAWPDPRERLGVGSSHPENSLGLCVDAPSVVWRMF
ncbi:hypothetical protein HYPSUDRAFT_1034132 [Hypholoma sublateritium FD-334 SS-4]|uniref:Uncharacterized protein n=1 Tax=Hypholoma sublateritium (strain FD-334 SS-4) TaxID=945553 RepID=A0A0D2P7D8_HYPSF|nr:hypothetical protein HYPSUDRAFT_1034132 [Hypholoma sublateritium FD-334 SS-4]